MQRHPSVFPRPSGQAPAALLRVGAALVVIAAGSIAVPGSAVGQELRNPLVPAGRARVDFSSSYTAWDSRFGIDASGADTDESLGSDLTDPDGARIFPGLESLHEHIRALTGNPTASASLGSATGEIKKDVTRIDLSLELGIFDWLTIGATVPWLQNRTTLDFAFLPTADTDLGLNPTLSAASDVGLALFRLSDAAASTRAWADGACQAGLPECSTAGALADRLAAFSAGTQGAYAASPFFPEVGSVSALAIEAALADLDADLTAAGRPATGAVLPFATESVDAEALASLVTDPAGGYSASPLADVESLWLIGDVEVHAAVRLLQGGVPAPGEEAPRFSYVLVGRALARLGTGVVEDPDVYLDMGTGDGQMDLEAGLFGALNVGSHVGLRAAFRYGVQATDSLIRRVAPHELVLAPLASKRLVRWSPGSYWGLSVSPRWHVTEQLSFAADLRHFSKGPDRFEIIGDAALGGVTVDPADLEHESAVTVQEVGLGLTYSTMSAWRAGRTGSPLEFSARVVRAVAGSGGQTPKTMRLELGFQIFRRLWGRR